MRYVYISVLIFLLISTILFVSSFFYLDKINHETFYFTVRSSGRDIGAIKIDRFVTEDKIIYKSVTSLPFEPLYTEYRSRLVMDKMYNLESYTKERTAGRIVDMLYIENFKNMISFVSRYQSKFACAENIPVKRDAYVFEDDSPVTYMPIIENYDFSKGRSQGFNAISCFQAWYLPPMKRFITLTSIKDEYIKIGSHKIKAENLVLKIRDYPQGSLWVAKADRSIIKLEILSKDLTIMRTFKPVVLRAADRYVKPDGYISKDITFKSGDVDLAGTLTVPIDEGRYAAVLLAPGVGPQDRDYQGLFAGIADHLSRNGYVTMRFDKRGVGASGGDGLSATDSDESKDLDSALQYLATRDMVDPRAIFIIGHSSGAVQATKSAVKSGNVKGVILMAPAVYPYIDDSAVNEELRRLAQRSKWTNEYLDLAIRSAQETKKRVVESDKAWVYILGKRCFLAGIREELANKPDRRFWSSQLPVLIIQWRDADELSKDSAAVLDKAFADAGNIRHTLTYYTYVGQFFGQRLCDGIHRAYFNTDKEVLENIRAWLNAVLVSNLAPSINEEIKR